MTTLKVMIMQSYLKPHSFGCLLLAAAALAGAPAYSQVQDSAQQTASSGVLQPAGAADGFYEQLGGKDGVAAIVAEFVSIMLADKRIADTFEGVDMDRLHAKLAEQFCMVSGGPCSYTGKSMQEVHEDMKINNARFNASVEDLQSAMTRRGVPSRVQNRLLGKLAPTQRSIVTQ